MRFTTLLAVTTALVAPAAAHAQSKGGDVQSTSVNEVVVTARKREERLKDVPIAVTAVTADTLQKEQIYQVKDIAAYAPGLNINSDAVGRSFISIRGIGATLIDTVQPGVGIFVDGIYEPDTSYLNSPLLDVQQIEVLRGPQGTLFGNNTLGGAISVITRQPSDTPHLSVMGAYAGPDDFNSGAVTASGPLIPGVLQAKVGLSFHNQDGFEKNTLVGGYANPLYQRSADAGLRWVASPNAVITVNGYYNQVKGGETPYADVSGVGDYSENETANYNSIAEYTYAGGNVKGVFDVPAAKTTITAVAAYDSRDGVASGDGDFGPINLIHVVHGGNTLDTETGELRFDTHYTANVSSLIGLFADQSTTNTDTNDIVNYGALGIPLPPSDVNASDHAHIEAQAIYGTLFWKLSDYELAAGLRVDHQVVKDQADPQHYETTQLEPRITLTRHWDANWMTYASISRGFRGGGTNGPGAPNPIYRGDSVWTYELGTKYETDDHKWSVDADVFYNDYSDFIGQNSLAPGPGGTFVAINLNTGAVQSYGAELEADWRPTDRLDFSAGVTLLHARITDGSEYTQTTTLPLPSNRILFTPDWNFDLNGSYTQPIGEDSLRFDGTLIGKGDRVGSTLTPTSVPVLPAYLLVNASITYIHGPYQLAVFSTNLTNTKYWESYLDSSLLSQAGLAPIAHNLGILGDRQRVGVRASYKF
jgi:iron complex outermembrane receptor protein